MTLKRINNLIIRPIHEGDKHKIIRLWHRCGLFEADSLDAENEFKVASLLPNSQIFVAEKDDDIIAVVLGAVSHTSGWLWDLAVDPYIQGKGLGKTMVRHAENWVKKQGCKRSMLFLQNRDESLLYFYAKLSYENVTDNIMCKPL